MNPELTLKVYRDGELLSTKRFDREIIKIGRLSSAHLKLDDEKVSRIHAVIEVAASGEVHIIDMGSTEGTFVNGQRVNKAVLHVGDEIQLGDTRLVLSDEGAQGGVVAESLMAAQSATETQEEDASQEQDAFADFGLDDSFSEDQTVESSEALAAAAPVAQEAPAAAAVEPPQQETRTTEPSVPLVAAKPAKVPVPPPPSAPAAVVQHRVALPPPRELGELRDDEHISPDNWTLEVRKMWGDTVLNVKNFQSDTQKVLVGEDDSKVDFFMPSDLLPDFAFPVARLSKTDAMLSFSFKGSGELQLPSGEVQDLNDLSASSGVGQDPDYPDCRMFTLPQGAVATLRFGQMGLRFRYVSKPIGYMTSLGDRLDYTFLNSMLLILFIATALVSTFHLRPKSIETSEEELYKVPDRFVQFILTRPKPQKKDLIYLDKLKADIDAKSKDSAERYKGQEGKMGLRGRPDTGKRSAVRAIKPDDKEIVGNRGLLAVLGAGGPQGLSTVMGGTGLGGELEGAIGNMFGNEIGNSGGFGGLGLKGTGTGGGGVGNTIGVGRLGTRGRGGGGNYGYGTGVAKIRRRGERGVNISVGRPIIMGSLSMEIIRRVIHSHRDQIKYCYSQELTRNPNLAGKVAVKFTISPKGYVQQSSVSSTTLNNAAVERCITEKVRTWKFPEPKGGGIVIVNYPFILKSN